MRKTSTKQPAHKNGTNWSTESTNFTVRIVLLVVMDDMVSGEGHVVLTIGIKWSSVLLGAFANRANQAHGG
jgi:hypothetical protein